MASSAATQISGTVSIRPVRIGVVLEPGAADDVLSAFRALAGAWGGCFSTVMSDSHGVEGLTARFHAFDLDALWLWQDEHPLLDSLRKHNLLWLGFAEWGPFGHGGRYSHGLLPWKALQGAPSEVADDHDPLLEWFQSGASGQTTHLADLSQVPSASLTRSLNHSPPIILLLDRQTAEHQIRAWNLRALAARLAVVDDSQGSQEVDWDHIVSWCRAPRRADGEEPREVWVWDLRSGPCLTDLRPLGEVLDGAGISWVGHSEDAPPSMYPRVLKTDFNTSFNVTVPYGNMRATVSVPAVPLAGDGSALGEFRTVAAETHLNPVTGHDPRLVSRLPDDPRFSDLLHFVSDDFVRVSRPTEWGFVAGIGATALSMNVLLHRKSQIFQRLFGKDDVLVEQSDVGLFQTRAAEMLGGSNAVAMTQPGLAAALQLLMSHPAGVPLPRLRAEIQNKRGSWPDRLSRASVGDYAESVLRRLVSSGMVRALLKAKCSYCRTTMQVDPDDLANAMSCDFCGQEVRLATMIGWGSPKWVFRLAGHLSEAQVQAMIPALATLGQLSQLTRGGIDCSELGLMVTSDGKVVEADIAAYLASPIPLTVLGEVKSRNRIDANDIANLEWLQDKLTSNGFDSIILFATTKDAFGREEVAALRKHCGDRAVPLNVRGSATPRLPLLLTGKELFLPSAHDDNIDRWGRESTALGIHGTARESCRRNLGLDAWAFADEGVSLTWKDADDG